MSYTPMSDLGQQGLFDITRLLLQQPDLAALSETLTRLVQQSALADEAAIILWNAGNHRAARYACDEAGHPVSYEDETVLAHGPVRRLLSRPDALHCDHETFADTWPQLIRSGIYRPFGYYSLLPLAADGRIFGGCEFLRRDNRPWSEKEFQRLHTFAQIVAVVTEQIQNRVSNNVDYDLLCHERDNFRILVAITNAVLSRLDIDELVSEVAKEIHRYFRIDAISVVLRSDRKGKLNIYSTHYLDASHPVHDQSEVDEAGTLTERVFKSKEMLLLNLHEHDTLAPYEKMLFEMWGNKIQTLCLLPLMSGNTLLGVLKLAQCDEQVFTTTNLKLLRQIAERVSIAIDNALAYREIQRLKERLVDENLALTEQLNNVESEFGEIIGRSEAMNNVLKQVEMVAHSDSTVLILGETGTGKELIARAIHNLSGRNSRRMVKMNCAAMPAGLLESDLFGHERGAFTGAVGTKKGRFELAHSGTLFLDEIGELSPEAQSKLLRALQEGEIQRLGSEKSIKVDVRIICATHQPLENLIKTGKFREDLYYRINVFPIFIPPLRERREDILPLAEYFLEFFAKEYSKNIKRISMPAIDLLTQYQWPGNVRELRNCMERAALICNEEAIRTYHLPPTLQTAESSATDNQLSFGEAVGKFEQEILVEALQKCSGNMLQVARELRASYRIINYKIKKYNLDPKKYDGRGKTRTP